MATGIFATLAEVQKYVPIWANATYSAVDYVDQFTSFWESYVNVAMNYNWSDNYVAANIDTKRILSLFVVAQVVMDICAMDDSGTDSRTAEFFFDRMTDVANKAFSQLKEDASLQAIKDNAA